MKKFARRSALVASLASAGLVVTLTHGHNNPTSRGPASPIVGGSSLIVTDQIGNGADPAVPIDPIGSTEQAIENFLGTRPGTALFWSHGRIERVYGRAFAHGFDPIASAESFRHAHAGIWGIAAEDLMPISGMEDGRHTTPVMIDPVTGEFKFTLVMYSQFRDGLPVYGSQLRLLVRNEADHPLVLASANLRDIGNFAVPQGAMAMVDPQVMAPFAIAEVGGGHIHSGEPVIFAGHGIEVTPPRLAWNAVVINGVEEWRVIVDAETKQILYKENLICFQGVSGNVSANVTTGVGADICSGETLQSLPYVRVSGSGQVTYTDEDGNYALPVVPFEIVSILDGLWFDIADFGGPDSVASAVPGGPGEYDLVHNPNSNSLVRAQVNAYLEQNRMRDWVLVHNPAYPTLMNPNFQTIVNRTDNFCPGNAWYSPSVPSTNYCQAGPNNPNTAFASVIFHEYGHHLVQAGGSGQGAYGEGMGDVMSVLMLDSPLVGLGFFNNCTQPLRNADNDCQFQSSGCSSCGSAIHSCGRLLSGAVWSTRNELVATNPSDYLEILSPLVINSILLHTGTSINASITIDLLTLDDDNGDIFDGTPHYHQINNGFSQHNMAGPALAPFVFTFPNGLPDFIAPSTVTTVNVYLEPLTGFSQAGSGKLHYRLGGSGPFSEIPMIVQGDDNYLAAFPPLDCGNRVEFFFSAESTAGQVFTWPVTAPLQIPSAWVAYAAPQVVFIDDFSDDLGWISGAPDDDATTGHWVRANPVGTTAGGAQVQPNAPFVGSACWITGQHPGGGAGANDVDNGKTTLFSPVYDLTGFDSGQTVYVSYWRWYSNAAGANPFNDIFEVDVSADGGQTWTSVEVVGPTMPEVNGGWFFREWEIAQFVPLTDSVQFRFVASDYNPQALVEAAVDLFQINAVDCTPPGPLGDLNGDGVVDGADLGVLLNAWGACDGCPADLNGDGVVDGADLGILLNAWS